VLLVNIIDKDYSIVNSNFKNIVNISYFSIINIPCNKI
jgi:hypothetical protein